MNRALKLGLALFVAIIAQSASAMSLGSGKILNHVGEPLVVDIDFLGAYDKTVRFYQLKRVECRASLIGRSSNSCDAVYDKPLTLTIKQHDDGARFLRVTGGKGDELFYHILLKSLSRNNGSMLRFFDFLPEFGEVSVELPHATAVPTSKTAGIGEGRIAEKTARNDKMANKAVEASRVKPRKANLTKRLTHPTKGKKPSVSVRLRLKKGMTTHLQIRKDGEYADDIHALQKENGEIETQIALLKKHIALLKEVIQLKKQAGDVVTKPLSALISVQSGSTKVMNKGVLSWFLLAVIAGLLLLLAKIYRQQAKPLPVEDKPTAPMSPPSMNEIKSLDLTDSFVKPNW
ncbi:MAG: hypothetical protein R8K48_08875 [Gallionella sp.]